MHVRPGERLRLPKLKTVLLTYRYAYMYGDGYNDIVGFVNDLQRPRETLLERQSRLGLDLLPYSSQGLRDALLTPYLDMFDGCVNPTWQLEINFMEMRAFPQYAWHGRDFLPKKKYLDQDSSSEHRSRCWRKC